MRESFATSVLWAGEIAADDPDGRALVDFTPFLVRDAHDIVARLKARGAGELVARRRPQRRSTSTNCLAFPENLEFESLLTFQSAEPGAPGARDGARRPAPMTLVQHHSLLRLPDAGYQPRPFDPRAGLVRRRLPGLRGAARPSRIETRWIVRHRLEKVDPAAARSRVKEPIVYYVDSRRARAGAQRSDGGGELVEARPSTRRASSTPSRSKVLPPGAHPLDARYNVIQWVHRSTRGWSYGGGVIDPRTGEMLKGHVTLGSLRVRQDRLIFEGLAGAEKTRHRRAGRSRRSSRSPASASSPPTRWGTAWGSPTTSPPRPTAAPR